MTTRRLTAEQPGLREEQLRQSRKKNDMKKKTVTKKTTKQAAEEQAKAVATLEHLEMLSKASDAARDATFRSTVEYLSFWWKKLGLGENGVIVLPKSWHEGPEQHRRIGFMNFKSYISGHIMLQQSATEKITALLDSKDQSTQVATFLINHRFELARLGTLGY